MGYGGSDSRRKPQSVNDVGERECGREILDFASLVSGGGYIYIYIYICLYIPNSRYTALPADINLPRCFYNKTHLDGKGGTEWSATVDDMDPPKKEGK